jgi:hypothetical protein
VIYIQGRPSTPVRLCIRRQCPLVLVFSGVGVPEFGGSGPLVLSLDFVVIATARASMKRSSSIHLGAQPGSVE